MVSSWFESRLFGLFLISTVAAPIAGAINMLYYLGLLFGGGDDDDGNPLALASALESLERGVEIAPMKASPTTAHMFIVNPLRGGGIASLLSTHPPTEERVRRLREMAGGRY